jgi:hypothetical protein
MSADLERLGILQRKDRAVACPAGILEQDLELRCPPVGGVLGQRPLPGAKNESSPAQASLRIAAPPAAASNRRPDGQ